MIGKFRSRLQRSKHETQSGAVRQCEGDRHHSAERRGLYLRRPWRAPQAACPRKLLAALEGEDPDGGSSACPAVDLGQRPYHGLQSWMRAHRDGRQNDGVDQERPALGPPHVYAAAPGIHRPARLPFRETVGDSVVLVEMYVAPGTTVLY